MESLISLGEPTVLAALGGVALPEALAILSGCTVGVLLVPPASRLDVIEALRAE